MAMTKKNSRDITGSLYQPARPTTNIQMAQSTPISRPVLRIGFIAPPAACATLAASSIPHVHASGPCGLAQRSVLAAQHQLTSLGELQVGGIVDRQLIRHRQLRQA